MSAAGVSTGSRHPGALLGAAHPGPALAVTVLTGLLAAALGLPPGRAVLLVVAVAAGQLSIGWCNDLVDLERDRTTHCPDKPLVSGAVAPGTVRLACAVAVLVSVPLGFALGPAAGLANLVVVASGWAYDLGAKATVWSWLPYAVAFGTLPALVSLADAGAPWPPAWMPAAGALLGVGAHVLNVLPDLADDEATGVRGLPHRLGPALATPLAVATLLAATVVILLGSDAGTVATVVAGLAALALGAVALRARGRGPFLAAVGIALVDVVLLLIGSAA